jgi:hypothetical protein
MRFSLFYISAKGIPKNALPISPPKDSTWRKWDQTYDIKGKTHGDKNGKQNKMVSKMYNNEKRCS